ncbi:unknown [Bacteroides sp. CAG:633]|nr:unknown [Bacteroides sp. CAG:633]
MNHGVDEVLPHLVDAPLTQDGLNLEEQTAGQQQYQQQAAQQLPPHPEQQRVRQYLYLHTHLFEFHRIVGIVHLQHGEQRRAEVGHLLFAAVQRVAHMGQLRGKGHSVEPYLQDGVEALQREGHINLQFVLVQHADDVDSAGVAVFVAQHQRVDKLHVQPVGTYADAVFARAGQSHRVGHQVRDAGFQQFISIHCTHFDHLPVLLPAGGVQAVFLVPVTQRYAGVERHTRSSERLSGHRPAYGVVYGHRIHDATVHIVGTLFVFIPVLVPQPVALPRNNQQHGRQRKHPYNLDPLFHSSSCSVRLGFRKQK